MAVYLRKTKTKRKRGRGWLLIKKSLMESNILLPVFLSVVLTLLQRGIYRKVKHTSCLPSDTLTHSIMKCP